MLVVVHKSVKNYGRSVDIRQNYCNNIIMGDVFIGPFCSACCLIRPYRHCRKDHFILQKCRKIHNFNVDFFKMFSVDIAPRAPYWGGATAHLCRPHPVGASRLLRLTRDLRSLYRRAPKNYFISMTPLHMAYPLFELLRRLWLSVETVELRGYQMLLC